MPLVSSSSNEPMSNASAALTSPLGGIRGGVYFCKYTCCQSRPAKKGCSFNSSDLQNEINNKYYIPSNVEKWSYPLPRHPILSFISRCKRPSKRSFKLLEKESGSSTFCNINCFC